MIVCVKKWDGKYVIGPDRRDLVWLLLLYNTVYCRWGRHGHHYHECYSRLALTVQFCGAGTTQQFLSHIYSTNLWTRCNSKMDATNTVQSWGHPQSDSLGSYTSSEIGSKLSKHGIHLDRFFRCTRPVYLYLCPVGSQIDAHSICLWYSVWSMHTLFPIMSCGLSQCPVGTPNKLCPIQHPPYGIPPWGICPVGIPVARGIPSMPCGLFLYALWAFTLRPRAFTLFPVGTAKSESQPPFHIVSHMPVVFSMPNIPPWTSHMPSGHSHYALWVFQSCPVGIPNSHRRPGVFSDMVFSQTCNLNTAWFSNLPWKLSFFSWKC